MLSIKGVALYRYLIPEQGNTAAATAGEVTMVAVHWSTTATDTGAQFVVYREAEAGATHCTDAVPAAKETDSGDTASATDVPI